MAYYRRCSWERFVVQLGFDNVVQKSSARTDGFGGEGYEAFGFWIYGDWDCAAVYSITDTMISRTLPNFSVERMAAGGRRLEFRTRWAAAIAHFWC